MEIANQIHQESEILSLDFQIALEKLELGKYQEAKLAFSNLLQNDPEDLEFQAGFFCAGWWLNRENSFELYHLGRPLASWIMQEWEAFSKKAEERTYKKSHGFQKTMQHILDKAANNFRQAFQEEDASSVDSSLLKELSICLMQLKDYENAIEILQYAIIKKPGDAFLCFLLAELLCYSSTEKKKLGHGLSYYREAFLLNFYISEVKWISSRIATQVLTKLYEKYKDNPEQALTWFPAHLMAISFVYNLRPLKYSEIHEVHKEIKRLLAEKERVMEKYRDKLVAVLCFYLLVLIYQYKITKTNDALIHEYEELLNQADSGLYQIYKKNSR